jgi:hypothetical protein
LRVIFTADARATISPKAGIGDLIHEIDFALIRREHELRGLRIVGIFLATSRVL